MLETSDFGQVGAMMGASVCVFPALSQSHPSGASVSALAFLRRRAKIGSAPELEGNQRQSGDAERKKEGRD